MSWTRSEPRTARPFYAVSLLSGLFKNSSIMVGDQEHDSSSDSISVEPEAFLENDLTVLFNLDVASVAEIFGGDHDLLKLQVVIRDPMFKRRKTLLYRNLLGEAQNSLRIDSEIIKDFSHGREMFLTVSVVMARDVESLPGRPSRVGEWIAKRTFRLAVPSQISNFKIREMSPEQARLWLGSEGALVYVEYNEGSLISIAEEGLTVAECYVAKKFLDRLKGKNSPVVNGMVSSEIIYRILRDGAKDIKSISSVPPDSPLASVLDQMSTKREVGLGELKRALDKPDWLRSLLEDRFSLVDVITG